MDFSVLAIVHFPIYQEIQTGSGNSNPKHMSKYAVCKAANAILNFSVPKIFLFVSKRKVGDAQNIFNSYNFGVIK